jgi:hypothetical protein
MQYWLLTLTGLLSQFSLKFDMPWKEEYYEYTVRYNFTSSKRRNYNRLMYRKVIDFAFFGTLVFAR